MSESLFDNLRSHGRNPEPPKHVALACDRIKTAVTALQDALFLAGRVMESQSVTEATQFEINNLRTQNKFLRDKVEGQDRQYIVMARRIEELEKGEKKYLEDNTNLSDALMLKIHELNRLNKGLESKNAKKRKAKK